ncbi:MAG: GNAT family N-acetyltransferase [Micromonosporaceae bacterium]
MHVREWDPQSAAAADVEAWRCLINDLLKTDLPDEPAWRPDLLREYLAVNLPEERRLMWFAEQADNPGSQSDGDRVLGAASLLLAGGEAGVLNVLVRPDARRNRIAQALLTAAAWRANAEHVRILTVEVIAGTGAAKFYEACGFERTLVEVRHRLCLEDVDWPRTEQIAGRLATGYRVEHFPGGLPEELLEPYARAKLMLRELPGTDLHTDQMVRIEANRLRASLITLQRRGLRAYVVLVIHEQTEQIAGLTELVVPAHRPERADQYDTLVVPAHRGYGLGLAMKARMLLALRDVESQVVDVVTWQTTEMEQMARVNSELGFTPDREWYEYETDVASLLSRLSR